MTRNDLHEVMEAEQAMHTYLDEDFDLPALRPWTMTQADIIEFVRRRPAVDGHDTRVVVVENHHAILGVAGCEFSEVIDVRWTIVHPESDAAEVVHRLHRWLVRKGKVIQVWLRDRDTRTLQRLFPLWKNLGCDHELVIDAFGDSDGWKLTVTSDKS